MEILKALVLGIVQALTEFLPVSSSGHLAIANALFHDGGAGFKNLLIMAHFGTMLATLLVFWKEIWGLILSLGKLPQAIKTKQAEPEHKMIWIIILASIPTGILGYFLADRFDALAGNLILVGAMLMVTGIILLVTRFIKEGKRTETDFGAGRALILGLFQGFAIMPGISRSGTTISTSLVLGAERKFAGRVSFLISLPAIAAAALLDVLKELKAGTLNGSILPMAVIFTVSFVIGYFALKLLLRLIEGGKFYIFSVYCLLAGAVTIVLRLLKVI